MSQATQTPAGTSVSPYWRSLDQIENTEQFQEFLAREFPTAASEFPEGISRRRWIQLMSASFALAGAAGCRWETEQFAPFAERPEGYIPGKPDYYATNISWAGGPKHLLVTKYDGRPIKVEGNPEHPASGGASDTFTLAATLALYDPDRSGRITLRDGGKEFTKDWADFEKSANERLATLSTGAGLALLMPPLDSYALFDAVDRLVEKYPEAKFYSYTPLSRENELRGAEIAFGKPLRTHYRLADAKVIATFDADLLGAGPETMRSARDYAAGREPGEGMSRLYAIESCFTTTGAAADHRLPVKSSAIGALLGQLRDKVKELAANADHAHSDEKYGVSYTPDQFIEVLADDLVHNQGAALVAVGPGQPAEVHALAHEINSTLGALGKTVLLTEEPSPKTPFGTIAELTAAAATGKIDTLFVLDGNPAYDAPAPFAEALKEIPHTFRLGTYDDETAKLCQWSLPETHPFEQWGDVIGWDGTVGVTQPLIDPLLGGRSKLELLALLAGDAEPNPRQLVLDALTLRADNLDEAGWERLLHDGLPTGNVNAFSQSGLKPAEPTLVGADFAAPAAPAEGLEIVFTPSSSTYDGRFANSGWLQETPDFLTKLTWDNAALVAPSTADKLGLKQGELAELTAGEVTITAPVYVMPGQAPDSIAIALGYGRTAAGRVGGLLMEDGEAAAGLYANDLAALWIPAPADPVGVDAYPLRATAATGFVTAAKIKGTGKEYLLATTQDHHAIDQLGLEAIGRRTGELIRERQLVNYVGHEDFAQHMSHDIQVHDNSAEGGHRPTEPLWQLRSYDGGHAWGMSIDLNKCIGCNACMVACQAENNVPVVGKDQVSKGREMHWIRIDRYFKGVANPASASDPVNFDNPQIAQQPIACQQCETAPCEQVCPVAATVHDNEGLNNMVYNRCIGTRYCANNCPYKVRRFNYFRYTKKLNDANNLLQHLVINPEVTVRSRGVMEKCTFCQQRISTTRITAKNEGRAIRDGEVQTACQQACPAKAIEFGDLMDQSSRVSKSHADPRAYGILTELMTKPRNLFLAKIRNPHERLAWEETITGHGHDHDAHDDHEGAHDTAAHSEA
ncbi:TAT-variant-translocated molybdopterin oxidoreductase [Botrimarina hoheduenensis]|uniref:Tetrathionate reductase subunit B n=1 Tax=Botrimarina hoheduenensis TaxID=2528000 RepID=A0A5C5WAW8_9BACT|nr:TAT-variant-translocated molybdopterin oxidoreductase [Botrimarina hoheduenensis]TWT46752.1 Tetrathionate reductase subunit B precursor [Botrimarina hoheduenensis]